MQILDYQALKMVFISVTVSVVWGCSMQKMNATSCVRAMVNPALTASETTNPSDVEKIMHQVLTETGFNRVNDQYFLNGYKCYVSIEWIDDKNLTMAFYLPQEEGPLEFPEKIQQNLKENMKKVLKNKNLRQLSVSEEIRLTERN